MHGSNANDAAPGPMPCPIRFTRAICGDLGQADRREWWLANGRGGYAGGTGSLAGADEPEANAEVVIYGIVSLYERFPPRPGGTTPGTDATPPAAP